LGLIFRIIGFIGGITFIVTGFGVLGDPNCETVSFSGLHAVTTTCYADSSGAIPAWLGGLLSIIAGLILIGFGASPFLEIWLLRRSRPSDKKEETSKEAMRKTLVESRDQTDASFEMPESWAPSPRRPWYKRAEIALPLVTLGIIFAIALAGINSNSGLPDTSTNTASSSSPANPATYSQICSSPVGGNSVCLPSPNWSYEVCSANPDGFLYQEQADKTWSQLWAIHGENNGLCAAEYPYDLKVTGTINNLSEPINLRLVMAASATHAAFNSDFQIYPQK